MVAAGTTRWWSRIAKYVFATPMTRMRPHAAAIESEVLERVSVVRLKISRMRALR